MTAATLESALIAHAPDAIIFADGAGVIRLWNQGAETVFGHRAEEAVGQTLDLIVPEPSRAAHWAGFSRAVEQGRFASDEALLTSRALTKAGREIFVELSAAIIRSPSGQVRGILAIGRDVTGRRAREHAQQERIESLERQMAVLTKESPELSHRRLLERAYAAFNARDIDGALATMDANVMWPNGMEGGSVHGHQNVRDYWTRQWRVIDPRVEPLRFEAGDGGRIVVEVHQVVHNLTGEVVKDQMVRHAYVIEDGRIKSMEIREHE